MTTTTHISPKIGEGVYTLPDAAKILELPLNKLRCWVSGYQRLGSTGQSERRMPAGDLPIWGEGCSRGFNFYTLIELYVIAQLRKEKVSMRVIRNARDDLMDRLGGIHPFARKYILTDGKRVLFEPDEMSDPIIALDRTGQWQFDEMIKEFCKRIDFSENTQMAETLWPDGRGSSVMVNPHHGFGRPVIYGTNITSEVLNGFVDAGEKPEVVAHMYGIDIQNVLDAAFFENRMAA